MRRAWVEVNVVGFKLEDDQDIHVVVVGASGKTMIVEFPDPSCLDDNLRFKKEIIQARKAFLLAFGQPSKTYRELEKPAPVVITGPAFFDRLHKQTGVADNGIEIHPPLSIRRGTFFVGL